MNLDTIAKMSCNPSIGGTAKGHLVREIDALGGLMGKIADRTSIQFRMLNRSKGPAVRSPRSQADKAAYSLEMKRALEETLNLEIKQATIDSLFVEEGQIRGILTKEGITYLGKSVVLSAGTFMRGLIHIGLNQMSGGRGGDPASMGLSPNLQELGFKMGRLKTGTPPRIHRRSINYALCEEQPGDPNVSFSYDNPEPRLPQVSCFITYTTPQTHEIIRNNLSRSPLYAGIIQGVGPRYCPSIEDKVVRFADKERHQIFLEPEGLTTAEVYVNGISSSLPFDAQLATIHSIIGLEAAEVMRPAYAIEYDYVTSGQIYATLETKLVKGLFLAGQINGTTGYEEAAGQGLIAGANAACKALNLPPLIFKRSDSYLGVMIDDLIRFELTEPYRLFTSRAEYRLLLRQDNADLRLRPLAYPYKLISSEQYQRTLAKQSAITEEIQRLEKSFTSIAGKSTNLSQLLCRPDWDYAKALEAFPDRIRDLGEEINTQIETEIKYAGYIERQQREAAKWDQLDQISIPAGFNYDTIIGLRTEARQKLHQFTPSHLGQASRISGVSPADISILMVSLR
jgi:tRNA uridine 5-carboxymethylaminomethyl modification enzyme